MDRSMRSGKTTAAERAAFGRRLETAMIAKGMRQSDLARRASERMPKGEEIRRDTINSYIHGRSAPGPTRLRAMAAALECEPAALMPELEDLTPPDGQRFAMTTTSDGRVLIEMHRKVTMATAAEIMRLIQNEEG